MGADPPASVVRLLGALAVPVRLAGALVVEGEWEGGSKTGSMIAVEIGFQAGVRLQNTEARSLAADKARHRATRDQKGEPV
jgi:hypothetical protein